MLVFVRIKSVPQIYRYLIVRIKYQTPDLHKHYRMNSLEDKDNQIIYPKYIFVSSFPGLEKKKKKERKT